MNEFKVEKRDMFNENRILTYKLVCDEGFTYKELIKALHKLDYDKNCIEEVIGEPAKFSPYKLKDGREIKYVLDSIKKESNDMRWIIEWYEGVWSGGELPIKKKKGLYIEKFFVM